MRGPAWPPGLCPALLGSSVHAAPEGQRRLTRRPCPEPSQAVSHAPSDRSERPGHSPSRLASCLAVGWLPSKGTSVLSLRVWLATCTHTHMYAATDTCTHVSAARTHAHAAHDAHMHECPSPEAACSAERARGRHSNAPLGTRRRGRRGPGRRVSQADRCSRTMHTVPDTRSAVASNQNAYEAQAERPARPQA